MIEGNANPDFPAPDNPAMPRYAICLNVQLEFVGNADAGRNVEGGSRVR